jgi:hypothetical protein
MNKDYALVMLGIATLGVFALTAISLYLINLIGKLHKEIDSLQPPF